MPINNLNFTYNTVGKCTYFETGLELVKNKSKMAQKTDYEKRFSRTSKTLKCTMHLFLWLPLGLTIAATPTVF